MTRRDPPLRIGRLRLSGRLTEIRAAQLACTREEAAAVLRTADVRLPDRAVTQLWERTEGWMAAVCLGCRCAAASPLRA